MGISWILYIGIRESAKINNIIVAVKIAVILLSSSWGVSHVDFANFNPFAPIRLEGIMAERPSSSSPISVSTPSPRPPRKPESQARCPPGAHDLPGVIIILYVSVAFVLTGMVPFKEIDVGNRAPRRPCPDRIRWGGALVATGAVIG